MSRTFQLSSQLSVPADRFWNSQSLATVNAELHPLYRMTAPQEWLQVPIHEWAQHKNLLKSWILFGGLIPVDRHCFRMIEFPEPRKFVEKSASWLNRLWQHERIVLETNSGCEVHDKISFTSRLPYLEPLQKALYILAFRHRHANLKHLYAATGA